MHKITYQTYHKDHRSLYVENEADFYAALDLLSNHKIIRAIKVWMNCETLVTKKDIRFLCLEGYPKLVEEFTWNFEFKILDDGSILETPAPE